MTADSCELEFRVLVEVIFYFYFFVHKLKQLKISLSPQMGDSLLLWVKFVLVSLSSKLAKKPLEETTFFSHYQKRFHKRKKRK